MLERFNKYTALVSVGVIWALSWVFVGVAPFLPLIASGLALCVSQLVFAFGEMVHAPTNPALIQELTPENIRGRSSSLMSLQWGISGVIGPAIAGSMIGSGLETQWVLVMLLGSLAPVPLFMQIRRHQIRTRS
jgi:MFS family permease